MSRITASRLEAWNRLQKVDNFCSDRAVILRWQAERYTGGEEFMPPYDWSSYGFELMETSYFCGSVRRNYDQLAPLLDEFRQRLSEAGIAIRKGDRSRAAASLARLLEIFDFIAAQPLR